MDIFLTILFVLVATIDVFIIGISYGAKKIEIGSIHNGVISIISGLGTFLAMFFGTQIIYYFGENIGNIIGGGLLIILSINMLIKNKDTFYETIKKNPENIDINRSGNIDFFEIVTLAFVLAANNIGLGISAAISNLSIAYVCIFSSILSFLFLKVGQKIGAKIISKNLDKKIDIIITLVLFVLGLYILFN